MTSCWLRLSQPAKQRSSSCNVLTQPVFLKLCCGHQRYHFQARGEFPDSTPSLYALSFMFIAANLALGLFLSTLAKTQQQAMQMSFFFFLPQILLSGFIFPFEGMPPPAQVLGQALPLTHFLRIIRGIVLKGATIADLGPEIGALAAICGVLVLLSSLRFRKKLG